MQKYSILFNFLLLTGSTLAQTPVLVKDINPGSANAFPFNKENLVSFGNVVYFTADDGIHGLELWRSDGSEAGTTLVKDIRPDSEGSAPLRFHVLSDKILFFANDGSHGDELWSSDGTEAGTVLVKDINPGAGHAIRRNYAPQVRDQKVLNGVLYFAADVASDYSQLWRTDCTTAGTVLVKDVCPGCDATNFATREFTVLNDTLYFDSEFKLWRSDGTTAGTKVVIDDNGINGPGSVRYLTAANGLLYMAGGTNAFSLDLWVSDGTAAGTHLVKDFTDTGTPRQFTAIGDKVFFIADDNLWSTDGTEAGTQLASSLVVDNANVRKSTLFGWNEELYYRANATNKSYVYKTDGSSAGEVQVFSQNTQSANFAAPLYFAANDNFIFYDAINPGTFAPGIARVNKTGTIKEIIPIPGAFQVEYLFVAGDNLFFLVSTSATGTELWKFPLAISATSTLDNSLALHLYPSLSHDRIFQFNYTGDPVSAFAVSVYDGMGSLMYQSTQSPAEPLRLGALAAGVYFVRIAVANGQFTVQKIVIE